MIDQISLPHTRGGLRFDWYSVLEADFINNFADILTKEIAMTQGKQGITWDQQKERHLTQLQIAKHLLSALYQSYTSINSRCERMPVSVPRDANLFSCGATKKPKIPYSYRYLSNVINSMINLGWVEFCRGREGSGYSRLYASGILEQAFKSIGLCWFKQTPNPKESLIVLRDRVNKDNSPFCRGKSNKKYSKVTLETPDTPETQKMSVNLYRYNEFLTKHCIAFDLPDNALHTITKAMAANKDQYKLKYLDLSRTQLRRVFSRGDMTLHGRFYGGWWQSIPSKALQYRTHITIDGHRTCEIDYSSVCLRILYAFKGISKDPEEDLYDIGLTNWQGQSDPRRDLIKEYINAIMNDEDETFRLKKYKLKSLGLTHYSLHSLVLKRHHSISEALNAGIGLKTQYVDSKIAEDIMVTMMDLGILVLPIHDSFIVVDKYKWILHEVMLESFRKITGHNGSVDITLSRLPEYFGYSKEDYRQVPEHLKQGPSSSKEDSMMNVYLRSWRQVTSTTSS